MGKIKDRIDGELPDLRSRAKEIRKQVRAVGEAGATNWKRLKNAVDEELKDPISLR